MEMELKSIIEKIKEEGVGEAEKKAADIIAQAEQKAGSIITSAQDDKKRMIKKAEQETEKLLNNGKAALRQASRDAVLGLRQSIVSLFDAVMKRSVSEQLNADTVKKMVIKLAESITKDRNFDVEVLLSEGDKRELEQVLLKELQERMKTGLVIKASEKVEHGFRIGEKGGSAYYDFSDEAVAEAFKAYLNPRISEILTPDEENAE
ncbi:MAG: V-type ATP synthase subunit E [Candidatus Omnitrophica bacterium]|nr:V-type ATP synthase subunit E [Candidatus Omnitrophota bacterium]